MQPTTSTPSPTSNVRVTYAAESTPERVDVLIPVLHRPENVEPLMNSLRESTTYATAWFICEGDDPEEQEEARAAGANVLVFPRGDRAVGSFAEKINYAFGVTAAPWLLLVGDDVRFHPRWLEVAQVVARRTGCQVIGTNDLWNPRVTRGEHATHPILARRYVQTLGASWDGPGVVCHEGYRHSFIDDEIVTVAKLRRTFAPSPGSRVEHLHPLANEAERDEVSELRASFLDEDRGLFQRRMAEHLAAPE